MYVGGKNEIEWILDSVCSDYIINDESFFCWSTKLLKPIDVKVGDGGILMVTKVGNFLTNSYVNEIKIKVKIAKVNYVKDMDKNLLSLAKITNKNKIISINHTSKIYNKENKLIAVGYKEHGLYKMNGWTDDKKCNITEKYI